MNSIAVRKDIDVTNMKSKYSKKSKAILIIAALLLLAVVFSAAFAVNQRLSNSTSVKDTITALMNELTEDENKNPDTDTVCSASF